MHRLLGVLLPWRLVGGALSNEGLDERQAVDAEEYLLLEAIASVPPGIETLNDPARDIRLPGKEDVVGCRRSARLPDLVGGVGERPHQRVRVRGELVLKAQ